MNKHLDTSEILKLRETKWGFFLFINGKPQKLIVIDGVLQNKLTKKQLDFVNDYLVFKK